MISNFVILLLTFLCFITTYNKVNSQGGLNTIEYQCLQTLFTNFGSLYRITIKTDVNGDYYDFCNAPPNLLPRVALTCKDNSVVKLDISPSTTLSYPLGNDLSCFQNLTDLNLLDTQFIVDGQLFYSTLPAKVTILGFEGSSFTYNKLPSTVKSFESWISSQPQTILKFSWFTDLNKILIRPILSTPNANQMISFENDLDGSKIWYGTSFNIMSLNFPSFKYIAGNAQITLIPGYDRSSWSNLTNCNSLTSLMITSSEIIGFPIEFTQLRAENMTYFYFQMQFSAPTQLIDLSSIGQSFTSLSVINPGTAFSYLGGIPFIIPTNNKFQTFVFKGGLINNLDLSIFSNVQELTLSSNSITSQLPVYDPILLGKLKTVDISYNQISGTIDKSWCDIELIVSYNKLTGIIPPCFTVFFGMPDVNLEQNFQGNSFTNLDPTSPAIIIPNLSFSNVQPYAGTSYNIYTFYVYGENLGSGSVVYNGLNSEVSPGYTCYWNSVLPNKLISCMMILDSSSPPRIFNFAYKTTNPLYNFTLSWDPLPPQLTTVDWTTNTMDLVFNGSYFSYNKSIISITIGITDCLVTSATFYQIKCTLQDTRNDGKINILSFITVDKLTTQFTLNPGMINNVIDCEQFNNCSNHGYCNTEFGTCFCDDGFQGDNCSYPILSCPEYNGNQCNGFTCITYTGECDCGPNHQGIDCSTPFVNCPKFNSLDCNGGNNLCNNQTGICSCDSNSQGIDCGLPFISCPVFNSLDCNGGNNLCNNQTGICSCDSNHQSNDCSLPFVKCLNDCNLVGTCNNQTGICLCQNKWQGSDCSTPSHYVSAVFPSNTNGGNASFFGWFGDIHKGLQVFIGGDKECTPILFNSSNEIICVAPAGTGLHSVKVFQNSISNTFNKIYRYTELIGKSCFNNCTSSLNGYCNTTNGYCNCIGQWSGNDCSLKSNSIDQNGSDGKLDEPLPETITLIDNNGNTNMNNQQTNYQLSIIKLLEIDFNGNSINEYQLQNQWSIILNSTDNNIFTFIQSIQNGKCIITYVVEEIIQNRDTSFAGIDFKLFVGSVKMTVSIENYQYLNNLNTLQLQMKSTVNEIENTNDENNCNDDGTIEIDTTSINNQNTLSFISIKKDAKVLSGRFADKMISDGKPTFTSTSIVSKSEDSIIVAMSLPHCTNCKLDPDFSVLLSVDFKSECDESSKPWLIPIAVIIPCFGAVAIVVSAYFIYKKKFVDDKFQAKLKSLGIRNNK